MLNDETGRRSLYVFAAGQRGNVAPMVLLHEASLPVSHPRDIAYDRESDTLVILGSKSAALIPHGIASRSLPKAQTLAIYGDTISPGAEGQMSVSSGGNSFVAFALRNGKVTQSTQLALRNAQLDNPDFVSVARDGSVYFASVVGSVERFAAGARGDFRPMSSQHVDQLLNGGMSLVNGFTGDTAGKLYFSRADRNAIEIIEPSGRSRMLEGPRTGLAGPQGMTVDSRGALYVTNVRNNSVTVYSAGTSGNAPPIRTLSGNATGLKAPQAIATDADGTLYVFYGPQELDSPSYPEQFVAVFAAGAYGNARPRVRYPVKAGCFTNDYL